MHMAINKTGAFTGSFAQAHSFNVNPCPSAKQINLIDVRAQSFWNRQLDSGTNRIFESEY